MLRVCPRCQVTTERHFLCPTCGSQTIPAEEPPRPEPRPSLSLGPRERPAIGRGMVAGLVVSQGLYYALRNLASAALLAKGGPDLNSEYWHSPAGLVAEQVLQAFALFCGGVLAGAGHRQALACGTALGVANSLLLTAMLLVVRRPPGELVLYGQPVLHAVLGVAAAFVGRRVWQPAPDLAKLPKVLRRGEEVLTTILPEQRELPDVEPLPWGRILLGTLVAVGGTMAAQPMLSFVLAGGGEEMLRSHFITWQVTIVAQVLGGALAGSNTRHGFQYGFWVGILSAGVTVVLLSMADVRFQTHEALSWLLGLSAPDNSPAAVMLQAGQSLVLGVIGGWIGGLVLPRIKRRARRLDRGAA